MSLLPFVVLAALIAINALYVAAEFAAVAVPRSQLAVVAKSGNRRARGLLAVLENGVELDRYIAACQIGITLSSLVAGAYGQATVAVALGPILEQSFALEADTAASAALLLVLLVLTALQVVLGELVPKSLALQFPERAALITYLPARWSVSLYRWFIWLLNGSGLLLLKPFGVTPGGHQHVHSPDEIRVLLDESRRGGALSPEAHRRLERGLHLSQRTVRQMMTPRHEVHALEISTPAEEILQRVLQSPFSRLPVYRETLDQVVGAISTKQIVRLLAVRGELPPLEQLVRPIPFVPETLRAHRLVRFLQENRSSKAIVVSEFGGVQGLISIEDVLSELFGDIGDELKSPEPGAERLPDGSMKLPGSIGLDEAAAWLGVRLEGSAATLAGYIVDHLGRMPDEEEQVELDGLRLTVIETGPTAVRWVIADPSDASSLESSTREEGAR